MTSDRTTWSLDLEDGFELRDEFGERIQLPYRKVGELLLALVHAGTRGASRDVLAEHLWPIADLASRRVNFRQTLSHLRRALGDDALVVTRTVCRLASGFSIQLENVLDHPEATSRTNSPQETPVRGFVRAAEWLAGNDSGQVFDLLRSNMEFALAIPVEQMYRVLKTAIPKLKPNDPRLTWAPYWKGTMQMATHGVGEPIPFFVEAARNGRLTNDLLLVREASYAWALSEILIDRPAAAISVLDRAETTLRKDTTVSPLRLQDLRASALIHIGRKAEGIALLDQHVAGTQPGTIEFAAHEALRAFFLVTAGNFESALKINEFPAQVARESGHLGLEMCCRLTCAYVEAHESPSQAIASLTELVKQCQQHHLSHLKLYAQETLAVAYKRENEFSEVDKVMANAGKTRNRLGFGYTQWDKSRLSKIANVN